MGAINEHLIDCELCGVYNCDCGVMLNGTSYCMTCFAKSSDAQNRLNEMVAEEEK